MYPSQEKWVAVAEGYYKSSNTEGSLQSVQFMLSGGNNYTDILNLAIITYSHHLSGSVHMNVTKVIETSTDPKIGYVIDVNVIKIYVKTHQYTSAVTVNLLSFGNQSNNKLISTPNAVTQEPSGIVYV